MASCKSCSTKRRKYSVGKIKDIPLQDIGLAIASAVATQQVDKMLTEPKDGVPQDNFLAKNPMVKNAIYLGGGMLLSQMKGKMYKSLGTGMSVYGGMELFKSLLDQYTQTAVAGVGYIPPQTIGSLPGLYSLPGDYGVSPSVIAGEHSDKMEIQESVLTRTL